MKKFPCGICEKTVAANDNVICCDICNKWIHMSCNNIIILLDIAIEILQRMKHLGTVRSA